MIHPNTAIRFVSEQIGLGVFATADIAKGTIIYVRDPLELRLAPPEFNELHATQKAAIEKYSYVDAQGNLIAGTDGSGLVYRISPAGEGFVLYSAPKKEITALALDRVAPGTGRRSVGTSQSSYRPLL